MKEKEMIKQIRKDISAIVEVLDRMDHELNKEREKEGFPLELFGELSKVTYLHSFLNFLSSYREAKERI